MDYDAFNAYCRSFPGAEYVVQWGGAHVWKVAGKVFAIGGWREEEPAITFKATDIAFEMLPQQPGVRPAPYMASRGLKWLQHYRAPGLTDAELRGYIDQSYRLVVAGLSKKRQRALGSPL